MTESNLTFRTETGALLEIPPEGLLGLLALGAVGIKAWRDQRRQAGVPSHWDLKPPTTAPTNTIVDFHTQGLHHD